MLAVYRLGSHLPAPAVNPDAINVGGSSFLNLLNTFSGGGLSRLSIFALGIMPYITASIILQVMTPVFPSLQALQKEGELGQRRITQYTRYLTVALAAAQSLGYAYAFANNSSLLGATSLGNVLVDHSLRSYVLVVMTLTAGATLLMWIGELITQKGIGNGMSLLIFASILTSAPAGINAWWNGSGFEKLSLPIVILAVMTGVVYVQEGIRKIPIQYAKRMVGRRMTSGGSTYLPLRVNMAGVIPVIFASAIMILPATVASLLPGSLGPQGRAVVPVHVVALHHRRVAADLRVHVLLRGGGVQLARAGRQPQEVRRLHPRHPPRPPHCAVPRVGAGAPDRGRVAVPGHRRRRPDAVHQVRRVQHGHRACAGRNLRADRGRRCHRYHASDRVAAFDAQLQGLPEVGRRCLST